MIFFSRKCTVGIAGLAAVLLLAGCSSFKVNVNANPDVNPNVQGVPSSTVVYVYQLKDKFAFESANFAQIEGDDSLSGSVISKDKYIILPGQSKTLSYSMDSDTKFLGVAAGYRNMNLEWKQVVPMNSHYYRKSYDVLLTSHGLKLTD